MRRVSLCVVFLFALFFDFGVLHAGGLIHNAEGDLSLVRVAVDVQIRDGVARTRMSLWFHNASWSTEEVRFLLPLPRDAVVDDLHLWIDGRRERGELLPRWRGRKIYEDIVRTKRDPALLELLRPGLASLRIFPMPLRKTRRVELTFSSVLQGGVDGLRYRLPLDLGRIGRLSIQLKARDARGIRAVRCRGLLCMTGPRKADEEHASIRLTRRRFRSRKPFVVSLTLTKRPTQMQLWAYRAAKGKAGYFVARIPASALAKRSLSEQAARKPRNAPTHRALAGGAAHKAGRLRWLPSVLYIWDTAGRRRKRWELMRETLRQMIFRASPARFQVLRMPGVRRLFAAPMVRRAQTWRAAEAFLDRRWPKKRKKPTLLSLLQRHLHAGQYDKIVLLSDGSSLRHRRWRALLAASTPRRTRSKTRLFVICVRGGCDPLSMGRWARAYRGSALAISHQTEIPHLLRTLRAPARQLFIPRLVGKGLRFFAIEHRWLGEPSQGADLLLLGRYRGSGMASLIPLAGRPTLHAARQNKTPKTRPGRFGARRGVCAAGARHRGPSLGGAASAGARTQADVTHTLVPRRPGHKALAVSTSKGLATPRWSGVVGLYMFCFGLLLLWALAWRPSRVIPQPALSRVSQSRNLLLLLAAGVTLGFLSSATEVGSAPPPQTSTAQGGTKTVSSSQSAPKRCAQAPARSFASHLASAGKVQLPTLAKAHRFVPKMWAAMKLSLPGPDAQQRHARLQALRLALAHRILSRHTTFLVLERAERWRLRRKRRRKRTNGLRVASVRAGRLALLSGSGGGARFRGRARSLGSASFGRAMGGGGGASARSTFGSVKLLNRKRFLGARKSNTRSRISFKSSISSFNVSGSFGHSTLLTSSVRRQIRSLRWAYERTLKRNPNARGKLVFRLLINAAGRVYQVSVTQNTTGSTALAQACIRRLRRIRFPPAKQNSRTLMLPIVFAGS